MHAHKHILHSSKCNSQVGYFAEPDTKRTLFYLLPNTFIYAPRTPMASAAPVSTTPAPQPVVGSAVGSDVSSAIPSPSPSPSAAAAAAAVGVAHSTSSMAAAAAAPFPTTTGPQASAVNAERKTVSLQALRQSRNKDPGQDRTGAAGDAPPLVESGDSRVSSMAPVMTEVAQASSRDRTSDRSRSGSSVRDRRDQDSTRPSATADHRGTPRESLLLIQLALQECFL